MKIIHFRPEDFKTSTWAGGTTTELYLYPEDGSHAQRDFQLRISSATVDLEESDFTLLPGVERFITPLDGTFVLTHPDMPPVKMEALGEPYRFSGEVPTHCVGKARDFNLMLKGCAGRMELRQNSAPIMPGFNSFYPVEAGIFTLENQSFSLKSGDLLVVFAEKEGWLFFEGTKALTCRAALSPTDKSL